MPRCRRARTWWDSCFSRRHLALSAWGPHANFAGWPSGGRVAVVCGVQVGSALVASLLRGRGLDATLVMGGMVDWTERAYPTEEGAAG